MAEEEKKVSQEEQNEEAQRQSIGFINKAKGFVAKAKLSRYLSLSAIITGIIVYSLLDVGWDPWKIGWNKFIANVSLLIFLGVYGMFFGENEGSQRFKTFVNGLYNTLVVRLRRGVQKMLDKGYLDWLPDYIPWRYQKDYENACKTKLLSVRLFQPKIVDLSDEELLELKKHPIESGGKHYSTISDKQYEVIMAIKRGEVFVDYFDDYTFYTMEDNTADGEQIVTKVKNTPKRKEKISWQQRTSRLLMIIITSLILAGFFKQVREGDSNAVSDMTSRFVTLFVSMVSGFNTARLLNLEDIFVLKYKVSYNEVFLSACEHKHFTPVDYEEKAKQEYEEYKKEQEKAKANVVDPVAEEIPQLPLKEGN